ncbi:hypothetical protein BC833DRAFT_565076, partial [Globomyces pollinis-pini]
KEIVAKEDRYEKFPSVNSFVKYIPKFYQKLHLIYFGSPDVDQARFTDQNAIYFTLSFDEFYSRINQNNELYTDAQYLLGLVPEKKTQWKLIETDMSFIRYRIELIEKMEERQVTNQVTEEEGKKLIYSRYDGHIMPITHWTVDIFEMVEKLKHEDETGVSRSIAEADFVHLDIPYLLFPDVEYDSPVFVGFDDDTDYAESILDVFFTLSKKESIGWIWCSDLQYSRLYDAVKAYNEQNCKVYHIYMQRTNSRGDHIHGLSSSNAKVRNVMENAMLILRGSQTINSFKSEDFPHNLHPLEVTRNLGWNKFEKPDTFMENIMRKLHITSDKKVVDGFSGSNSVIKGAITNFCKSLICIDKDPSQTEYFQKRQQILTKRDPRFTFSKTQAVSTQILTFKRKKQKSKVIEPTESESEVEKRHLDLVTIEDNQKHSSPQSSEDSGEELEEESDNEDDEKEDEDSNNEEMNSFIVSSSKENNNESEDEENGHEEKKRKKQKIFSYTAPGNQHELTGKAICYSSCMGAQCKNPVANKGDICDSCSKFQCDYPACDSMCAEESNFCNRHP